MSDRDRQREGIGDPALSDLYRRARREQPPAALDAAILAQARRRLAQRRRRWLMPVSTVAVILLGFSLTLTLVERPEWSSAPPRPAPAEHEAPSQSVAAPPAPAAPPSGAGMREESMRRKSAPATQAAAPEPAAESDAVELQDAGKPSPTLLKRERQAPAAAVSGMAVESPQVWIDEMLELLRKGQTEAARQSLQAFRRVYPEHPLPPALKAIEAPAR
ncbi:MAG: hypothetical protein P8178_04375 [Candidatus Thiodiazotropha sp.]